MGNPEAPVKAKKPKTQPEEKPEKILGLPVRVEVRDLELRNGVWIGRVGAETTAFCEACRAEGRWVALNFHDVDSQQRGRTLMSAGYCPFRHEPAYVNIADFWHWRK